MATLFKTLADIKPFSSAVNNAVNIDNVQSDLEAAQEKYLLPELGEELYQLLISEYQANTMSPAITAMLPYARKVVAPLGLVNYKNTILARISESGTLEINGQNAEVVRKWVNDIQTQTLIARGLDAIDPLLEFLEKNSTDYPLWANSQGKTMFENHVLRTAEDFSKHVYCNASRMLFRALQSDFINATTSAIEGNIGEETLADLIAKRNIDTLTAEEKKAFGYIQKTVAEMAVAQTPAMLGFDDMGALRIFPTAMLEAEAKTTKDHRLTRFELYQKKMQDRATASLDVLMAYLNANASVSLFAHFFASDFYVPADTEIPNDDDFNNNSDKSFHL